MQSPIYAQDTLQFVTVATEFCAYLEQSQGRSRREFVDRMLKLLPLIYLKAQLLPTIDEADNFMPDEQVTEQDYEFIRLTVSDVMGEDDDYEDATYGMEMQQTEQLCLKTISEGLADMYQPLRNFVAAYRLGVEACMETALWYVQSEFAYSWGVAAVDTLRRLHYLQTQQTDYNDEDNIQ